MSDRWVRILSVGVTITSISNLSSLTRAFAKGFTEYKCVSQVVKDPDSLRHSAAVIVEVCGRHSVKGVSESLALCLTVCFHVSFSIHTENVQSQSPMHNTTNTQINR